MLLCISKELVSFSDVSFLAISRGSIVLIGTVLFVALAAHIIYRCGNFSNYNFFGILPELNKPIFLFVLFLVYLTFLSSSRSDHFVMHFFMGTLGTFTICGLILCTALRAYESNKEKEFGKKAIIYALIGAFLFVIVGSAHLEGLATESYFSTFIDWVVIGLITLVLPYFSIAVGLVAGLLFFRFSSNTVLSWIVGIFFCIVVFLFGSRIVPSYMPGVNRELEFRRNYEPEDVGIDWY